MSFKIEFEKMHSGSGVHFFCRFANFMAKLII
jgi:hypothetical protein